MKKILVIHTKYTQTGGEDISVEKELLFLEKYFNIDKVIFQNSNKPNFYDIKSFLSHKNKESVKEILNKLEKFNPDYIYIHNLWYKASLGILSYLLKNNYKVILKMHNFRYYCTKSFFSTSHLKGEEFCRACGIQKSDLGVFNKYFPESYLKSLFAVNFGKKYYKLLKNKNLKILTLTKHHKNFLINMGINETKIFVQPNPIPHLTSLKNKKVDKLNQIVYAGRISEEKGLKLLLNVWNKLDKKDYVLKVVGEGPQFVEIKNSSLNSESVHLLGFLNNDKVIELINSSKAVVTATKLYEGQPTLLCEAAALGVPSIFPNSGGIKEFFPEDYKFSYDQFNNEDLKKKLLSILNSKQLEAIGINSRTFTLGYLNEDRLLSKFNIMLETKL